MSTTTTPTNPTTPTTQAAAAPATPANSSATTSAPAAAGTPITEDPGPATEDTRPDREAARYRRQLWETETERDGLAERLNRQQRAIAEQLAEQRLENGAGLWLGGAELTDLVDDDGIVDPVKVTAAADAAAEQVGLARALHSPIIRTQGDEPERSAPRPAGFADAFAPRGID